MARESIEAVQADCAYLEKEIRAAAEELDATRAALMNAVRTLNASRRMRELGGQS